jgi:hypothetical protein
MDALEKKFNRHVRTETEAIIKSYLKSKTDKNKKYQGDISKKHPFLTSKIFLSSLKSKNRSKIAIPPLEEILAWESTRAKFTEEDISELTKHFIAKIRGLYKHGQTEKTGLCNMRILANIKSGRLTIAIAKNTLDAKQQWEERLIKALQDELRGTPLKDAILVISSKYNDLNGNATHCTSINDAFANYAKGNFKIIFVCSNSARVCDILEFLQMYDGIALSKQLPIDIQQDEAHNLEEGVPSKREAIENIIMSPYVESYVPVTASYLPLIKEDSRLWKKENLDMYAIDYTKNSDTISSSEDYSSIADANKLSFETIKSHPSYVDHKVQEFDADVFKEASPSARWAGMTDEQVKADVDYRRKLEFSPFMKYEIEAYNLGLNILDNYLQVKYTDGDTTIETPIILTGVRNLHIITTPLRVAFTVSLIKYAVQKPYTPICVGLYRSGIHISYKNRMGQTICKKYSDLDEECTSEELNSKIYDILQHIHSLGESIERPIIIMGNYKPTGESITFVNYKYGTIRSDTLLPIGGLTKEKSYQGFLRSCYKDTKFREHDPKFVHPPKWMIGSQASIDDAMFYEKQNDMRILQLKETAGTPLTPVVPPSFVGNNATSSIPMKLTILDSEDPIAVEIRRILQKKKRTDEDKIRIMELCKKGIDEGSIDCVDPEGKFNFKTYTLKDIRTWKKHTPEEIAERAARTEEPYEADYRFQQYDSKHRLKMPYINNKSMIGINECELLAAYDKYEYEGFVNHRATMWLSYRVE